MALSGYQGLSRAGLTFDFLHSTSTSHDFLFGAMAELLDNSRDARATRMDIFTVKDENVRGGFQLCFLDNGEGMSPEKASSVILFGESSKRGSEGQYIGQYGNGLKSGAMRVGRDFILFTKQGQTMTCLMMSRTFLEEEQIKEVIVPMPSFDSRNRRPLAKTVEEKARHQVEMEVIYRYSPFNNDEDFFEQFERIRTNSGTLVIIYHVKLRDNGQPELDIMSQPNDILTAGTPLTEDEDDFISPERRSLRSYASILYSEPRMKIFVQGQRVQSKVLTHLMYKPKMYEFTSYRFKKRSEEAAAKAMEDAKKAENIAREAQSTARELEIKRKDAKSKEARIAVRQAQIKAEQLQAEANMKKELAEGKKKALKGPKTVQFYFGMNLENRSQEGVFIFNRCRLIKMYETLDLQREDSLLYRGIVGMVEVPSIVLEPTSNKQDFADRMEYRFLRKIMKDHMIQYWKDINIEKQGVKKFWESYGYTSPHFHYHPSTDPKYIRKRIMDVPLVVQCDNCLKWRILPFSNSYVGHHFDYWECNMNTVASHRSCNAPEQKLNIPCKVLKKETKSDEARKQKLEAEIKKKQEMLNKMTPTSSKIGSKSRKRRSPSPSPSPPSSPEPPRRSSKVQRKAASPKKPSMRSPPPKPVAKTKPVGKAKPVVKTSKPVGKASPVVQKAASPAPAVKKSALFSAPIKRAAATKTTPTSKTAKKPKLSSASESTEASSSEAENEKPAEVEKPVETEKPVEIEKPPEIEKPVETTPAPTETEEVETTPQPAKESEVESKETGEISQDTEESSMDLDNSDGVEVGIDMLGERVEAFINGRWNAGVVVKVKKKNTSGEKWRVKFDRNKQDRFDKWYDNDSKELRLPPKEPEVEGLKVDGVEVIKAKKVEENETNEAEPSPEDKEEPLPPTTEGKTSKGKPTESIKPMQRETPVTEPAPSEKTAPSKEEQQAQEQVKELQESQQKLLQEQTNTKDELEKLKTAYKKLEEEQEETKKTLAKAQKDAEKGDTLNKICEGYRKCLRYFLPPSWPMTKTQIGKLTPEELVTFDLNGVFEHYEKNLRELVGGYHTRAESKEREAQEMEKKLHNVRRMVAQLLRTMTDTQDDLLPANQEGDEVDEILAVCLKEATQSSQ
ncbi:MORC family CW-type zinc finger protein 2 [Holothuria leucospilota]|uniref:MORC family CW-type zinc finger protein 2 n=1 Tax=Holothuria leucospilota TaxID=206669 RepID=A0A9Q1HCB4_HOLLE|nr:MORC family CW-type zinc finger protein 2 [Holothuria leucospilota]